MNIIKNTRSVSNKTSEQFRCSFMSQNRAVVENKRVLPTFVPSPGIILQLKTRVGALLKNGNFTNSFRIGWNSAFCDQTDSRCYILVIMLLDLGRTERYT